MVQEHASNRGQYQKDRVPDIIVDMETFTTFVVASQAARMTPAAALSLMCEDEQQWLNGLFSVRVVSSTDVRVTLRTLSPQKTWRFTS